MRRGRGVPVVGELAAPGGEGAGQAQLEPVHPCITSNPTKVISPPLVVGRGTLSLSPSIPRVTRDSGIITLRCKDLRVLQLEIEGAEASLDIARSIEVHK